MVKGFMASQKFKEKPVMDMPCENIVTMDSRYECPICLNYLEEAVVTSCGHRFCMACITLWLEQKGSSCPIDVTPLSNKDIFPDNFTRREILQAKLNSVPKRETKEAPPHVQAKHQEDSIKKEINSFDMKESKLMHGSGLAHDPLVTALYERIIFLEQRTHEQDILVENLRRKVANLEKKDGLSASLEEEMALRCCNGLFVWKISGFRAQLSLMKEDQGARGGGPPQMLYSPCFYTRPMGGYRFCMRLNLSPRNPVYLSLVVHVVRGEFDSILPWPFTGRITLELINQRDVVGGENLKETVHVGGDGSPRAFSRPPADGPRTINPRGFGYMEFVALSDLDDGGFISDDTAIIKVFVEHGSKNS